MKPPEGRSGTSRWQVFARTSLYLLGGSLQKAAFLLLLPFLVAALTPEEFTRFGLMVSAVAVLTPLFSLNAHLAPGRLYFDYEQPRRQAELLFSSLLGALGFVTLGLVACVCVLRLAGVIEPISLGSLNVQIWVSLVVVLLVAGDFGLTLIRIRGDAAVFFVVASVSGFGILAAFLVLGWWVEDGFVRSIIALAAGRGAAATIVLIHAGKYLRGARFRWSMLGKSLSYSWPTTFHMLALWAVSQSGRWIGLKDMTKDELAPYTLVTLIVGSMLMIGRALFEARLPDIGRAFAAEDYRRGSRIIRTSTVAALLLVAGVYVMLYVALFAWGLRLPAGYNPTPTLLVLAGVANLFDALYLQGIQILRALKKTGILAWTTVVSGTVTVLLSLLLVGPFRDTGLVVGLAAGLGVQAAVANVAARIQMRRAMTRLAGEK